MLTATIPIFGQEQLCRFSEPIDLEYLFDDGTIRAICLAANAFAIEVFLTTEEDGVLTITIPRNVLDVRNPDCTDKIYQVFGDAGEPKVFETNTTTDSRTIEIHYNSQEVREFLVITTDVGIGKGYKLGSECSVEQQWKNHWIGGNYYNSNSQLTFQVFKISYKISEGDVENVEYLNHINNIVFKTKIDTSGILQVKYPRNLPYTNNPFEDDILILVNGEETKFDEEKTECYREFSIPLQDDSSDIELLGTFNLGSSPIRSIEVPNKCILKPSPLHQILNGNLPENIICKPDLDLIFKSTDGSPACVKPKTAEKLVERGWASS